MPLKIQPRGKKRTLWIMGTHNGERVRRTTNTRSRIEAEIILADVMQAIEAGSFKCGSLAPQTFAKLVDAYERAHPHQGPSTTYMNKRLRRWFGDRSILNFNNPFVIVIFHLKKPSPSCFPVHFWRNDWLYLVLFRYI